MSRVRMVPGMLVAVTLAASVSGCAFFNVFWNARKAFLQAEELRDQRLETSPDDTVSASPSETPLYRRSITKASKLLDQYPRRTELHDDAFLLIGRSQARLGECSQAERAFQQIEELHLSSPILPQALMGRAECLLELGRHAEAARILARLDTLRDAGGPGELAWVRVRLALARLDTTTARFELDRMRGIRDIPPRRLAEALWMAGILARAQGEPQLARVRFLDPGIRGLPRKTRWKSHIQAAGCLEDMGRFDEAVAELSALSDDGRWDRERASSLLELGRLLMRLGRPSQAAETLGRLELLREPPAVVAEGLLLLGDDARRRRFDTDEAIRLYHLAAARGPGTPAGIEASRLAEVLERLVRLVAEGPGERTREEWLFRLAELRMWELGDLDSAEVMFGQIAHDTSATPKDRARAAYAVALVRERRFQRAMPAFWIEVVQAWPGTRYAVQAQRNAGVPVDQMDREDSAEAAFVAAERLWVGPPSDPLAAIEAHTRVRQTFPGTLASQRALFAIAWIHDKERADSAQAEPFYRLVVDSLPGTPWAQAARIVLEGGVPLDVEDTRGRGGRHGGRHGPAGPGEAFLEEGEEVVEIPLTPPVNAPPQLSIPDALPPPLEELWLDADAFE